MFVITFGFLIIEIMRSFIIECNSTNNGCKPCWGICDLVGCSYFGKINRFPKYFWSYQIPDYFSLWRLICMTLNIYVICWKLFSSRRLPKKLLELLVIKMNLVIFGFWNDLIISTMVIINIDSIWINEWYKCLSVKKVPFFTIISTMKNIIIINSFNIWKILSWSWKDI